MCSQDGLRFAVVTNTAEILVVYNYNLFLFLFFQLKYKFIEGGLEALCLLGKGYTCQNGCSQKDHT